MSRLASAAGRSVARFLAWSNRLDDSWAGDCLGAAFLFIGGYLLVLVAAVMQ